MFDWKEFERMDRLLSEAGNPQYQAALGQHHVYCRPKDLLRWIEFLCEDLGYLVLADITGLDHGIPQQSSTRFELVYHFLNMGTHQRLNLHLQFNETEIIPSIRGYYPHGEWNEREQAEMFGIKFNYQPESLLLPAHQRSWPLRKDAEVKVYPFEEEEPLPRNRINPNKSEAPYPEESYVWKKESLFSPVTGGAFEWRICMSPAVVVESQVRIGFHHTGFEKLLESKNWAQVLHLLDIINPGSSPTYSILWARCMEELFRVRLPERAQALRMILLELSRIAEHLTALHEICIAERRAEHLHFLNAREKIYELFERFCGHRQGFGFICIGGVKEDLPHGWIVQFQEISNILKRNLNMVDKNLLTDRSFRDSLTGPSVNAQTILQNAVSGPAMRASGLNFDLRKSAPFYFYQDVDFDIPVGIFGTTFDRYLIRIEEIRQSFRIITQVMDNLPLGEFISTGFNRSPLELLAELKPDSKSLFHSTTLEAPGGEAGVSVSMSERGELNRVKLKTPAFSLAQALPHLSKGLRENQLAACVASLGIRRFELDR